MTPQERQKMLRKLKYGPKVSRKELAKIAIRLAKGVQK